MASKKYDEAITLYQSLFNYKDSKEKRQEAIYQQALVYISNQKYSEAIAKLKMLEGYNDDVAAQLNVAKYGYAKANYDAKNSTTVSYLEELSKINYNDSVALYNALPWSIDIVVNDSKSGTENVASISRYNYFYFHITAYSTKQNETIDTIVQLITPDGKTANYPATITNGKTAYVHDFYGSYSTPGTATVNVYKADTNELLKSHSVELLP